MYDVYIAEATMENDYHNFDSPEKKEAYINEVFKEHNITQARWDTSLSWYSDRIDLYLKMNDSVKARLKRTQVGIDAQLAKQSIPPPSYYDPSAYSASYIPPYYSFAAFDARGGFRFRMDSSKIATDILEDQFSFSFHVIGIPPLSDRVPTALIALKYGDTILYRHHEITENRSYRIHASKYIENDTLKGISGFVRLQNPTGMPPRIQLYDIFLGSEQSIDPPSSPIDTMAVNFMRPDSIQLDTERKVE